LAGSTNDGCRIEQSPGEVALLQEGLSMLQMENNNLQNMVNSRLREVKLLYSLLKQVGHEPPKEMDDLLASSTLPSPNKTLSSFDAIPSPRQHVEGSSPSSSRASTASTTAAPASLLDLIVFEESPDPCGTIPPN
uniref:Opaque 2 n=1 Tax=Schistocephalus solidus TaxID=70667 RepID=A0A183SAR5_SCHSO